MKRLVLISLAALLLAKEGFCQSPPFLRNDAAATINGENLTPGSASVDGKGNLATVATDPSSGETQSVIPVSNAVNLNGVGAGNVGWYTVSQDTVEAASTTTVINATAHLAKAGDSIAFYSGTNTGTWSTVLSVTANAITLSNALPASPSVGNAFTILRPSPITSTTYNSSGSALAVALNSSLQESAATGILKLEDAAAASGDALVGVAGVVNEALASKAADGDYTAPALVSGGQSITVLSHTGNIVTTSLATSREDNADMGTGTAGVKILTQTQDPLTVDQDTNNDVALLKVDRAGRTITTLAPAGESWQSCTSQMTGTGDVSLKAAVASNRNYMTSLTCVNRSAVASSFVLKDGSTTIFIGGVGTQAATGGIFNQTFPVPLRSTSNTAFNIAMSTTSTDTFCCASGYISVN